MAETINKRDLVKACIALGNMTKAQIAEHLDMSAGSVSTQMTYLRWMDNYILTDSETKVLSFTDKETFEASVANKAPSKAKASTRTPAERAIAVAKTIENQEAALAKWDAKISDIEEMLSSLPEDADAQLNMKEAIASVSLLEVKLARNLALAATLPDIDDARAEVAETEDVAGTDVVEEEESTDELL